jgi:hypothetical protein
MDVDVWTSVSVRPAGSPPGLSRFTRVRVVSGDSAGATYNSEGVFAQAGST